MHATGLSLVCTNLNLKQEETIDSVGRGGPYLPVVILVAKVFSDMFDFQRVLRVDNSCWQKPLFGMEEGTQLCLSPYSPRSRLKTKKSADVAPGDREARNRNE